MNMGSGAPWRWWMLAPVLVFVLMFWCQLHGLITGRSLVSFGVSAHWALKASLGWIIAAALLARFGAALMATRLARRHPWAAGASMSACVAVITLATELWLHSPATDTGLWLYGRLPPHFFFSALLVGGFLWLRSRRPARAESSAATMVEVMTGTGRTQIRLQDIECLEAERNYINVHTPQRSYLLRQTLSSLEKSLQARDFLRIHRSTIVNRAMIRERRQGGVLVLSSGRTVRVSRGFNHHDV